jgi:hypothetical protein
MHAMYGSFKEEHIKKIILEGQTKNRTDMI